LEIRMDQSVSGRMGSDFRFHRFSSSLFHFFQNSVCGSLALLIHLSKVTSLPFLSSPFNKLTVYQRVLYLPHRIISLVFNPLY